VRDYVVEHLDDGAALMAIDETSLIKKGRSRGTQTILWTDGADRNSQVGVFYYISSRMS